MNQNDQNTQKETNKMDQTLTAEDVEFLTALANELRTQDTAHTRKPVIFQMLEKRKDIGVDEEYSDGMSVGIGDDGDGFYDDDVEGAKKFLAEAYDYKVDDEKGLANLKTLEDVADWCHERDIRCIYTGYRNVETFKGFFLTKSALKRHIQENNYHYNNPVSYAQAAGWRNPELERLLEIVEKFATVAEAPHD